VEVTVNDVKIQSTPTMKVLGLIFDSALSWDAQVTSTVSKSAKMIHAMQHLRKFLGREQLLQVTTSFLFSVLFYGNEVWFHKHLSFLNKQKIRSVYYKALRVIFGKHWRRSELDMMSGRANPDEWADYSLAKMFIGTVRTGRPERLYNQTLTQAFMERRNDEQLFVYDASTRKVGRQMFANRLAVLSRKIKFPWLRVGFSTDMIRQSLKKTFFNYARIQR